MALPGILKILRPNFFSIRPLHVVAQVKNDLVPAFQNVPRFGNDRRRLQRLIKLGQANHQVGDDVERNVIGGEGPVETRRFGADIDAEMVVGPGLSRLIVPVAARAEKEKGKARQDKKTAKWSMLLQ